MVGKYLAVVFSSSHVRHAFSSTQNPSLIILIFNIKSDLLLSWSSFQIRLKISLSPLMIIIKSASISSAQISVQLNSPHRSFATSFLSIGNGTATRSNIGQAAVEGQSRRTIGIDHEGLSHERIKVRQSLCA
jgi:hypothetical protein